MTTAIQELRKFCEDNNLPIDEQRFIDVEKEVSAIEAAIESDYEDFANKVLYGDRSKKHIQGILNQQPRQ